MKRGRAYLRIGRAEDFEVLEHWLNNTVQGQHANGLVEPARASELAENWTTTRFLYNNKDFPVAAVNWKSTGFFGNYSAGIVVGEGTGTEIYGGIAIGLLFQHLFHTLNAHRIEVRTAADNLSTMRLLRSGFMRVEGILRQATYGDGKYRDIVIAALLRHEFEDRLARGIFGNLSPIVDPDDAAEANRILRDHLLNHPIYIDT